MPPVSEVEVAITEGRVTAECLSKADCICPVCLEIFIEPVTLPCDHTFCKPCFLETVDKANLCCPLCRRRVSTWARLNGRNKTLVNNELWRQVQASFPLQCQRRLSGVEEEDDNTSIPRPRVCQPGELRREYQDQITKLAEEKRALEEASEEYIQRLLAEEEERLAEERRQRQEERQLEDDEKMAVKLSRELNPDPVSEPQSSSRPHEATAAKKKPNPQAGDIERFLCPVLHKPSSPSKTSHTSSFLANKENILQSGKEPAERPMPTLDYYGLQEGTAPDPVAERSAPGPGPGLVLGSSCSSGAAAKRKSCDKHANREEAGHKRACPSSSGLQRHKDDEPTTTTTSTTTTSTTTSTTTTTSQHLLHRELTLQEELLFRRRQQEEEDMRLALSLQKQLDREESQRAVDRSKGSDDQYQLRRKPKPQAGARTGPTPSTPGRPRSKARSRSSSSTSRSAADRDGGGRRGSCPSSSAGQQSTAPPGPASPSTPLGRSSKQVTLTEMFPSAES